MKKTAAILISAALTGAVLCSVSARETSPPEEAASSKAQAEAVSAMQTEAATEAEETAPVPQERPEYRALDYVKIQDNEYQKIHLSAYPPENDSEEAKTEYQTMIDTMIMTQLFSLYPVTELPQDLIDYTAGNLTATYEQYARMYGMDFASFLQTYLHLDENTFRAQVKKAAQQTLKEELLLKAVAEKENITVSDEEYEQGAADYAVRYGYESADALRQAFDEKTIRISLLMDKTFDYLESVTKVDLIIETETETETPGGSMTEAETAAQTPGGGGVS